MVVVKNLSWMIFLATILSGLLAGETVDRFIVGLPAWHNVGIQAWAEYSRHADLGNGIFLYPAEAIGTFLLLAAGSVILFKNKKNLTTLKISFMVYLATTFAILGLILTFFAAPQMLSIRHAMDQVRLARAFNEFYLWSAFRGIAQIIVFLICGLICYKAIAAKKWTGNL
jgi:hypothetical protein